MRRPIRKRDLLARIEALERRLGQPTPPPLDGQESIPDTMFSTTDSAHRTAHQLIDEDD